MAADERVECPMCGAINNGRLARAHCLSCGAELDELQPHQPKKGIEDRAFSSKWLGASLGISALLTIAVVFGVPQLIPLFDFEGSAGMLIAVPTWFLGGLLVGLIAPARTLLEPVIATLLVAIPTALVLFRGQTVKTMPLFMYGLLALVGLLFALIGVYAGRRAQFGPPRIGKG